MLNIFNQLIDANQKQIKAFAEIVSKINGLEKSVTKLSDKGLKDKAGALKKRAEKGEELDKLLPEAFALAREASKRVNKERPFDVQLMASTALHQGKVAEQKTGEGKTLSAAPAAFLNSLAGKGVHVVTVNDYLARRDAGWMGPVYYLLGISCAAIIHEESFIYDPKFSNKEAHDLRLKHLRPISRKEAYAADVTYGTNNEFGFDYLRDNMAHSLDQQTQRGHFFAIVDEVDSILIDEARTPLIISAPAQEPTDKYLRFSKIVDGLDQSDYVVEEKTHTAHLTDEGILKIEKLLGIDNLYEKDFSSLHHIEEALKARTLYQKDRDYIVRDNEVIIVDEFTGRLMPGRRYSEGLHQAIEAKEGVTIQQESQTYATISFQNYFRMYQKLAGMTGTAATEAEEFHKIYKLEVVIIPTNKTIGRKDLPDSIYKTQNAKYEAAAVEIKEVYSTGQPILVGTTSIEKNEYLSELLRKKGISHALLNAKNHEREAEIIAAAGEKGAVTVATNLAGRGVDIKLGKGVAELGGLYVLGTERHESRRIDNQLRGRSGRQGDPGKTKFFVSLEDDLMRIFGGDQVAKVMSFLKVPEDVPIEHGMVSKAIEGAQKKVEGHNFDARKQTVEYDDVMNQQRQIIYGIRNKILETMADQKNKDGLKMEILAKLDVEVSNITGVYAEEALDHKQIMSEFSTIIPFDPASQDNLVSQLTKFNSVEALNEFLIKLIHDAYDSREKQLGSTIVRQMESFVYLNTIDTLWIEHLDTIADLRAGIGLRGYAQRDPLVEYKREAFDLFERLMVNIDAEIARRIFKIQPSPIGSGNNQVTQAMNTIIEKHDEALDESKLVEEFQKLVPEVEQTEAVKSGQTKVKVERAGQVVSEKNINEDGSIKHKKVGRNEPCWCGSGKKYKKCHYPN